MKPRFLADADLDARVIRGVRRASPEADFQTAAAAGLTGLSDRDVLETAAREGRVLVSQDRRTMPVHFRRFLETSESPGVILLRRRCLMSAAIDDLVLIWHVSRAGDLSNRILWIPF